MSDFVKKNRKVLENFARRYNLKYLAVFGSQARGDATDESDVDLLVEYPQHTSLFDVVRMERELTKQLNHPVDLVSRKYLSKHIAAYVKNDLTTIYGQE